MVIFWIIYYSLTKILLSQVDFFEKLGSRLSRTGLSTGTVLLGLKLTVRVCVPLLVIIALIDKFVMGRKMTVQEREETFKAVEKSGNAILAVVALLVIYSSLFENGKAMLSNFQAVYSVEVFYANLSLKIYKAMIKAWNESFEDLTDKKSWQFTVVVTGKQGLAGGSGNPLEEAGNSCLRTSRSALHRDYKSRRRRTEPFSSRKRRSYRASAERTWRSPQRGSTASAADVQQTTGFQEPPASLVTQPENITLISKE